ncbi:recombinase family protein [Microbulbifer taiwanensis]|uniref:Recombinase family protein n=1 Tax=Microbulbifer taiwanensis TaxID=986746 RepID=A0ABW1YMX5_9GAMM|nr:recombinase family protein [Microbulbifer taiwanensis]
MAIVGYARVSTTGQSLDVQLDKLNAHGCERIFKDKLSGTTAQRPQLQECLRYLRDGDTLVCTKLDRLARSTLHLHQIADDLQSRGVEFVVIDQAIDTSTSTGKLMFGVLGAIAEFETALRHERQIEGIEKAKANGVRFGPKTLLDDSQIKELKAKRDSGALIRDLMKHYRLSKATVYRYLKESV